MNNKLFKLQPDRANPLPRVCKNRKEESVLTRLHIGHSFYTHGYLLKREEEPVCIGCDEPMTIEHILVKCWDFYEIRRKHYSVENFKILFRDVPPDKIFNFLKEIGLFYKIWKVVIYFYLIWKIFLFSELYCVIPGDHLWSLYLSKEYEVWKIRDIWNDFNQSFSGKMGYFTHVMFLLEMSLNLVSMFEVVPPPWTPSSDGGRFLIFSFYNQS